MEFRLSALCALVRTAGEILLGDGAAQVSEKGYADFVTGADLAVQRFLTEKLAEQYPGADLLSEESARLPDRSRPVFILDPVDGTTNLIRRLRQSCISLGLVIGGAPVIGIVYNPFSGELYSGERGCGSFLNGRRLSVRPTACLRDSLAAVGTSPYHRENGPENMRLVAKVFEACLDVRRFGSSALDLCAVADGRYELFCEAGLRPWDFCAGSLILTEAGGKITDWQGREPDPFSDLHLAATNGNVHTELLALLSDICLK